MAGIKRLIAEGDFPHSMDYYALAFALTGTGYICEGEGNECVPTATDEKTVSIDTGMICLGFGKRLEKITPSTVILPLNETEYDRYDIIYLVDDGSGGWTAEHAVGTPSEEPKHPDIPIPPARYICPICVVYWEGAQLTPSITQIKDSRIVMHDYMRDHIGNRFRYERTSKSTTLGSTGLVLRGILPAGEQHLFSVVNQAGLPYLHVFEEGGIGTHGDEMKTGIGADGQGGNLVCDEGKLGQGLQFSGGKFGVGISHGLLFELTNELSVDVTALSGPGIINLAGQFAADIAGLAGDGIKEDGGKFSLDIDPLNALYINVDKLALSVGSGLQVNPSNELEWITIPFTDLTDAPGSYTGHAGKRLVVNSLENGLEFTDLPSVDIDELITSETDISKLLAPDGTGGVEFITPGTLIGTHSNQFHHVKTSSNTRNSNLNEQQLIYKASGGDRVLPTMPNYCTTENYGGTRIKETMFGEWTVDYGVAVELKAYMTPTPEDNAVARIEFEFDIFKDGSGMVEEIIWYAELTLPAGSAPATLDTGEILSSKTLSDIDLLLGERDYTIRGRFRITVEDNATVTEVTMKRKHIRLKYDLEDDPTRVTENITS